MKRQSIHQQIDLLLNALEEQHEQFRTHPGTIPQMELDLLLQNTRQLYEAILMLYHNNALSSLDDVKAAVMQRILTDRKGNHQPVKEEKVEEKPVQVPVQQIQKTEPVASGITDQLLAKAASIQPEDNRNDKKTTTKRIAGGVNATLFEDQHSLADNFEDEVTLHEHIASKSSGNTLASQLHRKPLSDLKAAIGINEKFLFINQLFDGNLQDYSEAIMKLNDSGDLNSAKQFIAVELASRFNWMDDNEHVINFMGLVERRFGS